MRRRLGIHTRRGAYVALAVLTLIWGSNWPVIGLHGTFEAQIAIAEEYLAPFGTAVRDQVMFKNALSFYRRHKPDRR
jgi:predicted TIM-barrel fold metal-dependent hydrolase